MLSRFARGANLTRQRPNPAAIRAHKFVKGMKKSSKLLAALHTLRIAVDSASESDESDSDSETNNWNFSS